MHNEKILISLASYRESELENTVKSFYDNAFNKDRLLFSIVSQDYSHPDLNFINKKNIRYIKIKPEESYGVSWARSLCNANFSNYDYFLQIDAHMMAEKNWDIDIINKFKDAKNIYEKPVLTCYPAQYHMDSLENRILGPVIHHAASDISTAQYRKWPEKISFKDLTPVYYIQAALVFSEKNFLQEVPLDPEIDFFSEEIIYSIRAFCKNYTILYFSNPIFYHFYIDHRKKSNKDFKPMNDGNPMADYIFEKTRSDSFIKGQVFDIYGATKEEINAFCQKTGYKISYE